MVFHYKYVPEDSLKPQSRILEEGEGTYKIDGVFDTDKSGFPIETKDGSKKMLRLVLNVKDSLGQTSVIYDNIVEDASYRIKSLVDSIGLPGLYNNRGVLSAEDLKGRTGLCLIKTDKSENQAYKPKSVIAKYIPKNSSASDFIGDKDDDTDIPF